MRATWYVLEDGSVADPSDVQPDASGVLRNRTGMAVAMRGDVPRSRSINVEEETRKARAREERANAAPAVAEAAENSPAIEKARKTYRRRDMTAGKGEKYETR